MSASARDSHAAPTTVGTRLRDARLRALLSQDELAARIGVKSRATIARWESGSRSISTAMLVRVAEALGTAPSVLFGDTAPPALLVRTLSGTPTAAPPPRKTLSPLEQQALDQLLATLAQRPELLPGALTALDQLLRGEPLHASDVAQAGAAVLDRLRRVDVGRLTPVHALALLADLQAMAQAHAPGEDGV